MKLALIYSRQPYNQYAGGIIGQKDSENFWLYVLTLQLAARLARRPGVEIVVEPNNIDVNKDGQLTFADNVVWVNAQPGLNGVGSHHSNAMGDSCVLSGTSSRSLAIKDRFLAELNAYNFMPFNDVWTFNTREVSEMTKTYPPAWLLEIGQHDREDYAQWNRDHINDGSLAAWLDVIYARVFDLADPEGDVPTVPPLAVITPIPNPTPTPTPAVWPIAPRILDWSVESGVQIGIVQEIVGAKIDGQFGPETRTKTKRLQARLGQRQDGRFGVGTAEAYLLSQPNMYEGRTGMSEGAVKLLQFLVSAEPDGSFGPKTTDHVKGVQAWANLTPDGNVGPESKRAIVR